jgi:spermidine synthase
MAAPMQSVTARCAERPTSAIRAALGLVGFSAVIGQIVLMRELIVVFNGNEISLGIMLATWLLWTAVGSGVASRFVQAQSKARTAVEALECLLGVSLPPTIWMLRAFRTFFQTVPGELVGPLPMLLTSLVCLSVFCFLCGGLFVVAARMYQEEYAVSGRVATSSAYLLEAAGSGLGGILASVVLLRFLDSFQIAILVALFNLGMAAILLVRTKRTQVIVVALGATFAIPLLIYVAPSLNSSSQQHLWRGFHVLGSRDSIYGNLVVTETGAIRSIYDNGVILASAPDEAAAEEAVHYTLLEHPAPAHVLLIGGGVNGSIAQALKHPTLRQLDYVELDPALVKVTRQFFPAQSAAFSSDPRVHVHYADGRHYLKTTGDKFDAIIVDLPDPQTAQLNRFYTLEFFRSARDHLAAAGVLGLQLRSSEDYISPDLAEFLRCIDQTLQQVFPYIAIVPGETIHFVAAMQPDVLADDPQRLISRLRERNMQTQYVREYFLPFRMAPDRMAQVRQLLQPLPGTPVNRDFEPIAYYFDVVLWGAQFRFGYSSWFRDAARVSFARIIDGGLVILLLGAVIAAYFPVRETRARASAAYCVVATGFTLMALQIFLLLAFQSVYGYVYHQLAILIAMFMAGIAFGSWLAIHRVRSSDDPPFRIIATTQFILATSAPVLMFLVSLLSRSSATLLPAQFLFPALAALGGMLGGFQFPLATEIYLRDSNSKAGLGALYAIDLLGGCAGALLLASYLIPVFGFWKTAWLTAGVNLAPALLAARVGLESKVSQA